MNQGIVREDHKEVFSKRYVQQHKEDRQGRRVDPRNVNHPLCTLRLRGTDVLADHRNGGILYPLRDLVYNVIDPDPDAKGCRGHNADLVDHRVDDKHGKIDAAGLNCHRRTEPGDHANVFPFWGKALYLKIKAEEVLFAEKIEQRENEGYRLADDRGPSGAGHTPTEDPGKQNVKHEIDGRCDTNEQKRALGISHAAQDRGHHIVACRKDQSRGADHEIILRHEVGLRGDLHRIQYPALCQQHRAGKEKCDRGNAGEKRADDVVHFLPLFRAEGLRQKDLPRIGEAKTDHRGKIDDLAAL